MAESRASEIFRPVQSRSFGVKSACFHVLFALWMSSFSASAMCFRDGVLQIDNPLGARVRIGESGKLQHGRDVGHILGADFRMCSLSAR